MNTGLPNTVNTGYQQATTPLLQYNGQVLSGMTPDDLNRVKSQYGSVELSDGANVTAMAQSERSATTPRRFRTRSITSNRTHCLANLNTEVSVLNKINAANVLTLRTLQDSNKLLLSLLEQNVIAAKQQRETTARGTTYGPAQCLGSRCVPIIGNPYPKQISTSFVERQNLAMRMSIRRFTRLTNAFSKKVENHMKSVALHFMYYNFVRIHQTLRVTPALAAGITEKVWEVEDMVALLSN